MAFFLYLRQDKKRGQALVLVLLVLAVIMILSAATLTLAASHRLSVSKLSGRMQALYTAQAGVERALVMIKKNPDLLEAISRGPLQMISDEIYLERGGKKSYIKNVTAEKVDDEGRLKITSVGTFGNARKIVVAVVRHFHKYAYYLKGISVLPREDGYTLNLNGSFTLVGSIETRPALFVRGGINISGSVEIRNFEIYASGEISYKEKNLQDCGVYPYYGKIPEFPNINANWYRAKAIEQGQFYQGDVTFPEVLGNEEDDKKGKKRDEGESITPYSGIYFIDGDASIKGNYSGQAVIFATGSINVTGDLVADDKETDMLILIGLGDVNIRNHKVDALVVANNYFKANGNGRLSGGIVTRNIDVNGNIDIEVDQSLIEAHSELLELAFGEGGGASGMEIEIESWSVQ